jgi:hypothetical protein
MTPYQQSLFLFGTLSRRNNLSSFYSSLLTYGDSQMIVIKPSKKIFDRLLFCVHIKYQ